MFRPKDPYKNRPLPHTIGSKEWQEKWHIGLVESGSESEAEENELKKAETSSSSSVSSVSSGSSRAPQSESDIGSVWGITQSAQPEPTDIFEDISNENIKTTQIDQPIKTPISIQGQLTNELTKKIHEENLPPKDSEPATKSIFMPQRQDNQQVSHVNANLFDTEPPELEEPSSSEKKIEKPKAVNLFLDDEDDYDDDIGFSIKNEKSSASQPNKLPINLFADDVDDLEDDALFKTLSSKPKSSNSGLFDDSLIPSNTGKSTIFSSQPPKSNLFTNIFDDEPPDDDFDFLKSSKSNKEIEKEIPVSKEVQQKPKPSTMQQKKDNLFDDDDEEDDITKLLAATKKETKTDSKSVLGKGLFDDDNNDEELFQEISTKLRNTLQEKDSSSQSVESGDISTAPAKPIESISSTLLSENLLENESDGGAGLFGSKPQNLRNSNSSTSVSSPKSIETNASRVLSKSLFDDDIDDLFDVITSGPAKIGKLKPENHFQTTTAGSSKGLFDYEEEVYDDNSFQKVIPKSSTNAKPSLLTITKTVSSPQSPGEYYNDFLETISASKQNIPNVPENKPNIEIIIEEKPIEKVKEGINDSNVSGKSVAELRKTIEVETNEKISPKKSDDLLKPKKLNVGNLNINVSALLPGAKLVKQQSKEKSPGNEKEEITGPITARTSRIITVDNVDSSGKLTNLTKSRAKALPRRQSTRRGRLQHFERSMDAESSIEEDVVNSPIDDLTDGKSEIAKIKKPIAALLEKPFESSILDKKSPQEDKIEPNVEEIKKTVVDTKNQSPERENKIVEHEKDDYEKEVIVDELFSGGTKNDDSLITTIKSQAGETKINDITSTLFGDDNVEEDEDWLTSALSSKKLFDSEDKQDTDVAIDAGDTKNPLAETPQAPAINAYISERPPPLPSSMSTSGLFDDESDISWSPPAQKPNTQPKENFTFSMDKPPPLPSVDTSNLFSEDDGSGDDLFAKKHSVDRSKEKIKEKIEKIPKPVEKPKIVEDIQMPAKQIDAFFDDDDEDDDFFDKPPPLPERKLSKAGCNKTKTNTSISLFGEESDDDDLFSETKKSSTTSVLEKKSSIGKPVKATAKTKLFSDDEEDEDDDLFGTKSKPIKSKITSTSAGHSRTQKMKTSSSIENDPLADLLN